MEFVYLVNIIPMLVGNILFFFPGICLNSLVIVSFWRSVQLRKKLCYFHDNLSCCDLLVVSTKHPLTALAVMLWLTEKINVYPGWLLVLDRLTDTFVGFSRLAIMVMSIDQYLATLCPLFHRASVTKGKLLTLSTFLFFIQITVTAISINDLVISSQIGLIILGIIFIFPMLFINYKLFTIAWKRRRNFGISSDMKKSFSVKNISGCLLVVACLLVLSIPLSVYIVLRLTSKERKNALDNAGLAALWTITAFSMNSTLNCLIFFREKQDSARRGDESY